jgi:hypothetical protein
MFFRIKEAVRSPMASFFCRQEAGWGAMAGPCLENKPGVA